MVYPKGHHGNAVMSKFPIVQHQNHDVSIAGPEKRGLLLLTPHLGCFEVSAQACAERFGSYAPITVLFRPARKPWLMSSGMALALSAKTGVWAVQGWAASC